MAEGSLHKLYSLARSPLVGFVRLFVCCGEGGGRGGGGGGVAALIAIFTALAFHYSGPSFHSTVHRLSPQVCHAEG